jgi:hypothetical protein
MHQKERTFRLKVVGECHGSGYQPGLREKEIFSVWVKRFPVELLFELIASGLRRLPPM